MSGRKTNFISNKGLDSFRNQYIITILYTTENTIEIKHS